MITATLPPWLRVLTEIVLIIGAVASWLFIFRYMAKFRWWTTDIGRHLIAVSACLGAFYSYSAVAVVWPDVPGRVWVRGVLFVLITITIVWRLIMFERVQRQLRKDKK